MITGQRSTGRNQTFGFDQEENGYAMQRLQSHLSETSSQFHRRPSANDAEIQSRRRKFKRKTNSWTSRTVESFKTALPRKSKNA